jgi:hypothetical protein
MRAWRDQLSQTEEHSAPDEEPSTQYLERWIDSSELTAAVNEIVAMLADEARQVAGPGGRINAGQVLGGAVQIGLTIGFQLGRTSVTDVD